MTISRFFSALLSCLTLALPAAAQDAVGTPLQGDLQARTGVQLIDGVSAAAWLAQAAAGYVALAS